MNFTFVFANVPSNTVDMQKFPPGTYSGHSGPQLAYKWLIAGQFLLVMLSSDALNEQLAKVYRCKCWDPLHTNKHVSGKK